MKYRYQLLLLLICYNLSARDYNLTIFVDNLQQETAKTKEVNITHQCMTALQQRASLVLVSTSLWKNIVERKKRFEKQLEDTSFLASALFAMYQQTNQELKIARYNLALINQKLSQSWFEQQYPQLAALSQEDLDQLRFDFACYMFQFDMEKWRVYNAHTGMLLFVPCEIKYSMDEQYRLFDESDLVKHAEKKSQIVPSLEKLLLTKNDRWVMYLAGHGHPKSSKQGANIAGLKIEDFKDLLVYFHEQMYLKLLVYSCCYGGGVHTIEPYGNLKLHYPVIVTAATDAPIFGFGLFEGMKLPPYDDQFKLQISDVSRQNGLLPHALQNYTNFFKRAWKGQFDIQLVQSISKFFACDFMACHVQKIENYPLFRKAQSSIFIPMKDTTLFKLVQQVTTNAIVYTNKPILLYTKKVKKIKIDRAVSIISMLPGIQSHEIGMLQAPQVLFSQLLTQSFLSLEDMQAYKNFMIKILICKNDLIADKQDVILTNALIIQQQNLMPKFVKQAVDAVIYAQCNKDHYLLLWKDKKVVEQMFLDEQQIEQMLQLQNFIQQSILYEAHVMPAELLTFEAYQQNKAYQQDIVDSCVKVKVCKK